MRTLDLASQPNRTAMTTIEWSATGAEVTAVQHGVTDGEILDSLQTADRSGIDAPFGRPDAFAQVIGAHHDGRSAEEVEFFAEPGVTRFVRRLTDEKVRTSFGFTALIARAARGRSRRPGIRRHQRCADPHSESRMGSVSRSGQCR